jgi:endo-1,4-beta-xylanase
MGRRGERIRVLSLAAVVAAVLVLGACKPLREYPSAKAMFFGSAARHYLLSDPVYAQTLAREFGGLVPEYELTWRIVHPQQNAYYFEPTDQLVDFARAHDMKVRGVPLLWGQHNPPWLDAGGFTRAEMRAIMTDHITRVVSRYRGRVSQWDVVNEPFNSDGSLRNTPFRDIGLRYIDEAFNVAHAADPAAKLFLNEVGLEVPGPLADRVFDYVAGMRSRGVPINGVGFQMHTDSVGPTPQQLASQMARYASIGVEVAITEMDVRLTLPVAPAVLQEQARVYRNALTTCRAAPNCKTFVVWGFTDKYQWISENFPGFGGAAVLDTQYRKKPAYDALNEILANP